MITPDTQKEVKALIRKARRRKSKAATHSELRALGKRFPRLTAFEVADIAEKIGIQLTFSFEPIDG